MNNKFWLAFFLISFITACGGGGGSSSYSSSSSSSSGGSSTTLTNLNPANACKKHGIQQCQLLHPQTEYLTTTVFFGKQQALRQCQYVKIITKQLLQ